jgi:hypothetical protein
LTTIARSTVQLFSVLAETISTTGMTLGCMLGAATLAIHGPLAPLPAYYLPLGVKSLLFLGSMAFVECVQDLSVATLVSRTAKLTPDEKRTVMERAYPPLPERVGAILIAQATAAYIVYGFVLYPMQTAYYVRLVSNGTQLSRLSLIQQ